MARLLAGCDNSHDKVFVHAHAPPSPLLALAPWPAEGSSVLPPVLTRLSLGWGERQRRGVAHRPSGPHASLPRVGCFRVLARSTTIGVALAHFPCTWVPELARSTRRRSRSYFPRRGGQRAARPPGRASRQPDVLRGPTHECRGSHLPLYLCKAATLAVVGASQVLVRRFSSVASSTRASLQVRHTGL